MLPLLSGYHNARENIMNAHIESVPADSTVPGTAPTPWLQQNRNPKSLLKLILLGFSLISLPLIVALINSAMSIDELADQSSKAVYQASQMANGSNVLANEVLVMERSVRQAFILNDPSLLDGYFKAHSRFTDTALSLEKLSSHAGQKQSLEQLRLSEVTILQEVSATRDNPQELYRIIDHFPSVMEKAQIFSDSGRALIELEVNEMRNMADRSLSTVMWQMLALIPFVIFLGIFFSFLITRPIRQIHEAIHALGQGELSRTVAISGPRDLVYLGERLDWMRQRLLALEVQKTRFLRHISHELKTPLTAIREGADLLVEGVVGDLTLKQQQIASILYNNSLQLQKRIEDLLNYSALQTEKSALVRTTVRLDTLIDNVLQAQKLTIMNKHLTVTRPDCNVALNCDPQKICVILDNLLSNAIKFSPSGAQIDIAISQTGESVQIDIADQGPGIDEADQGRIFEPFYQGRKIPDNLHARGTGLGLSIAREYAAAHSGNIELVRQEAIGARFRLVLPVGRPEESHA